MLFHLQDVELDVCIAQQIDTVALRDVLLQVVDGVVDICRRVRLIICSVWILHGNRGVHGQSRVKKTVVAPVLMHLTA